MKLAPQPIDEKERLSCLRSYEILDTEDERRFDDITKAVAKLCDVEIALISLVDQDRQWFKSRYGLEAKETPRDISFCGHAIMGDDIFIVEDAKGDTRFCDNPLVLGGPKISFYAGVPLITPDNFKIGTLCVIDSRPKKLTELQIQLVKTFARNVVELFELSLKNKALKILNTQYLDVQTMVQAGAWELVVATGVTKWSHQIYEIYQLPQGTPTNTIDGLSYYAAHEQEKLTTLIGQCINQKIPFDDVFEFKDAKGTKKWVRSIGRADLDKDGKVEKIVGTFQDVTSQIEKEVNLSLVLHNISEGYFDWDLTTNYEFISPQFWKILGYDPATKAHSPDEWRTILHPDDQLKVVTAHELHFNSHGKVPYEVELRMLRADGQYVWMRVYGKVIEWSQTGAPLRMVGTGREIQKERELLDKIQDSSRHLDLAVEGGNIGIWDWDLRDNGVRFSSRWASLRGLTVADLKMDLSDWESRVHPDDLKTTYDTINDYLSGKTALFENLHRVRHSDGRWLFILGRGRFSDWDAAGKPTRFTGTDMDLTELISSRNKLDLFFKKTTFGIAFCDSTGKFKEVNNGFLEITGFEKDDLTNCTPWSLMTEDQRKKESTALLNLAETGSLGPYRTSFIVKNGQSVPAKVSVFKVDDYDGTQGFWWVIEDISANVKLENEKQLILDEYVNTNKKLETIFEHSPVVFYDCQLNENWTMNFINSHVYQVTGYAAEEFLNDATISFGVIIHPDDQAYVDEVISTATLRNESYSFYYRIIHKSGAIRWVWERGARNPELNTLIGVIIDVTDKKKQELMTETLSNVRSKFIEFSRDKKIFFNFVLEKILELTSSQYGFVGEILGSGEEKYLKTFSLTDISWNAETKAFFEKHNAAGLEFRNLSTLFGEVIKTGELIIANDAPRHPKANGIPKGHPPLENFMGVPLSYNGHTFAMIGVANNRAGYHLEDYHFLTPFFELVGEMIQTIKLGEELENQRRLSLHNAKLASIGELAAGVGHEINNPLAIILGQVEMLKMRLEGKGELDASFETFFTKMIRGIDRISSIVKGLRTFARMDKDEMTDFDFKELLTETVEMLEEIYRKEGVMTEVQLPQELKTYGNRGRLQQVLVNLMNNAKDAMVQSIQKKLSIRAEILADRIVLRITDTGSGVDPSLREKIFEPFFTTKDVNKGTGIGLSLAQSIIRDHQGELFLEQPDHQGSTFVIILPVSLQSAPLKASSTSSVLVKQPIAEAAKVGTALVVDDEADIRELLAFFLEQYKLEVLPASNAQEALELYQKNQSRISLVVSDMKMPGMTGAELAVELRGQHGFTGGFYLVTGGMNFSEASLPKEIQGIINKPFSHAQFQKIVKEWCTKPSK